MRTLSLILYNLMLPIGALLMAPGALLKLRRRGGRLRDLAQRFGLWPRELIKQVMQMKQDHRLIWMHAVSVGEVGVARKLIQQLLKADPRVAVLLTTTTPTGLELAKEAEAQHPDRLISVYSPLDLPFVTGHLLRWLRPWQMVLVEAEVWPNLMAAAEQLEIPVTLVNARLSGRSERRFAKFKALIAPIFGMLKRVAVQEPGDVERWEKLGVPRDRIFHTGSIKYDPQGSEPKPAQVEELRCILHAVGLGEGRPLLLAASTHAGEERALAVVYLQLINEFRQLGLLVVPRHFERGQAVAADLRSLGLQVALRSAASAASAEDSCDALVVDSTGELKAWQQLASVVVIGKSFLADGGQNPAEAVLAGKPVICGPHMENFTPLMKLLLEAKGALQVKGLDEVAQAVSDFLRNPLTASAMAHRGAEALHKHDGATQRTVALLLGQGPDSAPP